MVCDILQKHISSVLSSLNFPSQEIVLDHPSVPEHGDYATNVALRLKSDEHNDPREIAQKIVDELQKDEELKKIVTKIEIAGPGFINFWLSQEYLTTSMIYIIEVKDQYGKSDSEKGKKVIVEYSSTNIAKPFTIGHLRSTIIGDSVANILEASGWEVFRDNHVGDWGTQFGKQIFALKHIDVETGEIAKNLNNTAILIKNINFIEKSESPVKLLVGLYIKFHEEAEKNPALDDLAKSEFAELENESLSYESNPESRRILWKKCVEWSWKEFSKIYTQLNVHFTENDGRGYGESFFEDKKIFMLDELKKKNLLVESNGAKLVFFPNDQFPPLMIIKNDGATLYATRDLATDKFRLEKYGKDIVVINEVGAEQSLYFQQLYKLEEMLGWFDKDQRVHIKHGMYRFKDQKMSTRKGNVIWLEDVLRDAFLRANDIAMQSGTRKISENHERLSHFHLSGQDEREKVTKAVAIGALKWNDLRRSSQQDIIFDWDDILNMEGNSGPYMQYTYARCVSVIAKSTTSNDLSIFRNIDKFTAEEQLVLRTLYKFPEVVVEAGENFAPNLIANYLYDLAQKYNLFYQKVPILNSEENEKRFRLGLTAATAQVLKNGLTLLGIPVLEKM